MSQKARFPIHTVIYTFVLFDLFGSKANAVLTTSNQNYEN